MSIDYKKSDYHRKLTQNNQIEKELVRKSMEVWGGEAKVCAAGICVQALPGKHNRDQDYSFNSDVRPIIKYGFRDREPQIREYQWPLGHKDVQSRKDGNYACISISAFIEEKENGS